MVLKLFQYAEKVKNYTTFKHDFGAWLLWNSPGGSCEQKTFSFDTTDCCTGESIISGWINNYHIKFYQSEM